MDLTPGQRKTLRARAHALSPVVMIGDKGLTDAVLRELNVSLKSHELIKVHVAGAERDARDAMLAAMCERLGAQPVQHIGRVLVLYREKPPEPDRPAAKSTAAPGRRKTQARDEKPARRRSTSVSAPAAAPARRPQRTR